MADEPIKTPGHEASFDDALWEKLRRSMKGYNWLSFFVMALIAALLYAEFQAPGVLFWAGWLLLCQMAIALLAVSRLPASTWIKPYSIFFVVGCLGWSLGPVVFDITDFLTPVSEKFYGILLLTIAATIQNPLSISLRLSVFAITALILPFFAYELFLLQIGTMGENVIFVLVLAVGMVVLLVRTKLANTELHESLMLHQRLHQSSESLREQRSQIAELKRKAADIMDWDPLTGLHSTAGFWKKLGSLPACDQGTAVSVKVSDIDQVNTVFGSRVGEAILQDIAGKLKSIARDCDVLCRAGATSFIGFFPGRAIARDVIRDVMTLPALTELGKIISTKNIGVGYLEPGHSATDTVKVALSNTAHAGKVKRDNISIVEGCSGEVRNIELYSRLKFDLPEAIENDGLHLVYQPQHRASTGEVMGFEALVRWEHPKLGAISPATFVPLAEEAGLMIKLGTWVINRALRDAKNHAIFSRGMKLSVNISPIQVSSDYFIPLLQSCIEEQEVDPRNITLEITESTFMDDPDFAIPILKELKGRGFSIALDDFGTGYSSLSYLTQFPIDIVKIDRSLVSKITEDPLSKTLFGCILDMTQALDLPVVVEGVETGEQLQLVRDKGGQCIQGFLYSPGLAARDVLPYIQKWGGDRESGEASTPGMRSGDGGMASGEKENRSSKVVPFRSEPEHE